MKKLLLLTAVVVVAVAAIVALPASAHHHAGSAASGAKLEVHKGKLGRFIVNGRGATLYLFERDKNAKSSCYGQCAQFWPPLITAGKPVAGSGVTASKIGTTKRRDGKLQVTYGGHPLYRFVQDKRSGQTAGQGLKAFGAEWYVVAPSGKKIDES